MNDRPRGEKDRVRWLIAETCDNLAAATDVEHDHRRGWEDCPLCGAAAVIRALGGAM